MKIFDSKQNHFVFCVKFTNLIKLKYNAKEENDRKTLNGHGEQSNCNPVSGMEISTTIEICNGYFQLRICLKPSPVCLAALRSFIMILTIVR